MKWLNQRKRRRKIIIGVYVMAKADQSGGSIEACGVWPYFGPGIGY
jgi:hypothetical protein